MSHRNKNWFDFVMGGFWLGAFVYTNVLALLFEISLNVYFYLTNALFIFNIVLAFLVAFDKLGWKK